MRLATTTLMALILVGCGGGGSGSGSNGKVAAQAVQLFSANNGFEIVETEQGYIAATTSQETQYQPYTRRTTSSLTLLGADVLPASDAMPVYDKTTTLDRSFIGPYFRRHEGPVATMVWSETQLEVVQSPGTGQLVYRPSSSALMAAEVSASTGASTGQRVVHEEDQVEISLSFQSEQDGNVIYVWRESDLESNQGWFFSTIDNGQPAFPPTQLDARPLALVNAQHGGFRIITYIPHGDDDGPSLNLVDIPAETQDAVSSTFLRTQHLQQVEAFAVPYGDDGLLLTFVDASGQGARAVLLEIRVDTGTTVNLIDASRDAAGVRATSPYIAVHGGQEVAFLWKETNSNLNPATTTLYGKHGDIESLSQLPDNEIHVFEDETNRQPVALFRADGSLIYIYYDSGIFLAEAPSSTM